MNRGFNDEYTCTMFTTFQGIHEEISTSVSCSSMKTRKNREIFWSFKPSIEGFKILRSRACKIPQLRSFINKTIDHGFELSIEFLIPQYSLNP